MQRIVWISIFFFCCCFAQTAKYRPPQPTDQIQRDIDKYEEAVFAIMTQTLSLTSRITDLQLEFQQMKHEFKTQEVLYTKMLHLEQEIDAKSRIFQQIISTELTKTLEKMVANETEALFNQSYNELLERFESDKNETQVVAPIIRQSQRMSYGFVVRDLEIVSGSGDFGFEEIDSDQMKIQFFPPFDSLPVIQVQVHGATQVVVPGGCETLDSESNTDICIKIQDAKQQIFTFLAIGK